MDLIETFIDDLRGHASMIAWDVMDVLTCIFLLLLSPNGHLGGNDNLGCCLVIWRVRRIFAVLLAEILIIWALPETEPIPPPPPPSSPPPP
eukprot:scaffold549562_cov15-Prasinocladus_malaysianus.AAC.1